MNEILSLDLQQLSFGALFVWLLYDTNRKNETRENKYQDTISSLTSELIVIREVHEDVKDLTEFIKTNTNLYHVNDMNKIIRKERNHE